MYEIVEVYAISVFCVTCVAIMRVIHLMQNWAANVAVHCCNAMYANELHFEID